MMLSDRGGEGNGAKKGARTVTRAGARSCAANRAAYILVLVSVCVAFIFLCIIM